MKLLVRFQRRITVEEAETARIRVRSTLVSHLAELPGPLLVRIAGWDYDATLAAELCQCAGPSRPHDHHFLLLRGESRLQVADRVWVEVYANSPHPA